MQVTITFAIAVLFFKETTSTITYPLYNDLLELDSDLVRARRESVSSCYDFNSCCDMSNAHKNANDSMKVCIKKLEIQGRPTKDQIKCIAECMAKTDGYMDQNGILDKAKMKVFLMQKLSAYSDWFSDIHIDSVATTCVENIEVPEDVAVNECNDVAKTIGHCAAGKMQLYCPIEKQKDQRKCTTLQNYIIKNKNLPPLSERCKF